MGGDGPERDLVTVARLDDAVVPLATGRLSSPTAPTCGRSASSWDGGTTLHAIGERTWFRLTLDDVFAQLT